MKMYLPRVYIPQLDKNKDRIHFLHFVFFAFFSVLFLPPLYEYFLHNNA